MKKFLVLVFAIIAAPPLISVIKGDTRLFILHGFFCDFQGVLQDFG